MLYGNESIAHYSRSNIAIWMSMAFQGGVLNMGGFMACHRFVSHVTGFATFFGYEINQRGSHTAFGMLTVPLFFLSGAMVSGWLVDLRLKLHKKPKYYVTFGIIFLLNLVVFSAGVHGSFGSFGEPFTASRDYVLLSLLCFTCGIQNGTITTVSRSVVRTTHLTGITTDLGIGLVRVLNSGRLGDQVSDERRSNLMRFGIIVSFVLGSIVAGFAFRRLQYQGFLIPVFTSGALFSLMIYFHLHPRHTR